MNKFCILVKKGIYQIITNLMLLLILGTSCSGPINSSEEKLVQYVDPLIGTDAHGHVFLGASVPFGAVQLGPNNFNKGWDWCSGFHYSDSILKGFSHMNLSGTGCADLGDILVMPANGELKTLPGSQEKHLDGYASPYNIDNMTAEAGYFSLLLDKYNIKAELTATERVGFHRYTFPAEEGSRIIIDLSEGNKGTWEGNRTTDAFIQKVDKQTVSGYRFSTGWAENQKVFFVARFSKPFKDFTPFIGEHPVKNESIRDTLVKGVFSFTTDENEQILLKVGVSPVSEENALFNLEKEVPHWDFEKTRDESKTKWERELSKIRIEGSREQKTVFYTSVFHTMIAPALYNDVNRDYRGADDKICRNATFENYTVFSLWDTYRAIHPLYTIMQQDRVNDMINTMLAIHDQQGRLPEWHLMGHDNSVMIGYSAVSVIADAILKGFDGFDWERAYEACKHTAMRHVEGIGYVENLQYIPADKEPESVAKALEYAISDWGIAMIAQKMGKEKDHDYFIKRSKLYKKYYDVKKGFFRGKLSDGSWRKPFDPIASSHRDDDFCEGNAWQYLWLVPHDVEGLVNLIGGKDAFTSRLDSLFLLDEELPPEASTDISGLMGQYAHGNEPGHHVTYLYAMVGEQWKTAQRVREIMDRFYTSKPDGLCGNEDCGQMSAWYVFSAMGFYPLNAQNGVYVLGSPNIERATIDVGAGKKFEIISHDMADDNVYIHRVKWNGMDYKKAFITHDMITNGGKLEFFMGARPNKKFGD